MPKTRSFALVLLPAIGVLGCCGTLQNERIAELEARIQELEGRIDRVDPDADSGYRFSVPVTAVDLPAKYVVRKSDIIYRKFHAAELDANGWPLEKVVVSGEHIVGRMLATPLPAGTPFYPEDFYLAGAESPPSEVVVAAPSDDLPQPARQLAENPHTSMYLSMPSSRPQQTETSQQVAADEALQKLIDVASGLPPEPPVDSGDASPPPGAKPNHRDMLWADPATRLTTYDDGRPMHTDNERNVRSLNDWPAFETPPMEHYQPYFYEYADEYFGEPTLHMPGLTDAPVGTIEKSSLPPAADQGLVFSDEVAGDGASATYSHVFEPSREFSFSEIGSATLQDDPKSEADDYKLEDFEVTP